MRDPTESTEPPLPPSNRAPAAPDETSRGLLWDPRHHTQRLPMALMGVLPRDADPTALTATDGISEDPPRPPGGGSGWRSRGFLQWLQMGLRRTLLSPPRPDPPRGPPATSGHLRTRRRLRWDILGPPTQGRAQNGAVRIGGGGFKCAPHPSPKGPTRRDLRDQDPSPRGWDNLKGGPGAPSHLQRGEKAL